MNVLMIGLGDQVLTQPDGDVRDRHERYGRAAGHLTMLVYSDSPSGPADGALSSHLAAYPICGSPLLFTLRAVLAGLRYARRPVHLVTTQDPFSTGLAGVILSWLLHAPLLVQNHSDFFDNIHWIAEKPRRHGLFNRLGKWVIKRAAMNRVVNNGERDKYLRMGVQPARVRVIPLADPGPFSVDVPAGEIAARRASWGLDLTHRVVLWVGRPVRLKRLPVLMDVMRQVVAQVPDARLVLVGDMGLAQEDLVAEIRRRQLEDVIVMPGVVRFADLPGVYQSADVYAHTSIYEGLGRVMLEAGAAGLPVVAMDSAGVREVVVDGDNGYIVAQGDVDVFAARVLSLLNDPRKAREMGLRGREIALTRFDPARLFDDLMQCWQDAAERR